MAAAAMPGAQLELAGVAGDGVGQSASFLTLPSDVCVRVCACVKETDCLQYVCLPQLPLPPAPLYHPLPLCSASSCNLKWTTPLKANAITYYTYISLCRPVWRVCSCERNYLSYEWKVLKDFEGQFRKYCKGFYSITNNENGNMCIP